MQLDLDIAWKRNLWPSPPGIYIAGNPLTTPPVEIVKQGKAAILNYFAAMEEQTTELFEAKALVVGQGEVGKTCLLRKLLDPRFEVTGTEQSTDGIDIHTWEVKLPFTKKDEAGKTKTRQVDFKINFWDFGGQEIYHATHQFFLTKRSLYILVWDARKEDEHQSFDYWLNVIKLLSAGSPCLMVMNKHDQRIKQIETVTIQKQFPNIKNFYQVSAKTGYGIDALRKDIQTFISELPHIGDSLPKVWQDIRTILEGLGKDFISYREYLGICSQAGLDETKTLFLSSYFHDLGVFLHFKDDILLGDMVILKPEWATDAVYNITDAQEVREKEGMFTWQEVRKIWKNYPRDKHPHLLHLMEKFELCFPLASESDPPNTFIIPELMAANPPDQWETDTPGICECGQMLLFEYHYKFMPAGIITRFIVRQHINIHKNLFWKHGVLLKYRESFATVVANSFKRTITIHVYGSNEDSGDVLSLIRNEFEYIHKTLNFPEVKEQIPCNCRECCLSMEPWFFDFAVLKMFLQKGKNTIACNQTAEDVDITRLVRGYRRRDFPSLFQKQECTVFLSHSSQDKTRVRQIYDSLKDAGIKAWLDEKEIFPGDSIVDSINRGLEKTGVLILVFSRNSIKAPWVKNETNVAIHRKNNRGDIRIMPVLLEKVALPPCCRIRHMWI